MSWDYRLIHHNTDEHEWIGLHEVFYDKDGSIRYWTEYPSRIVFDIDEVDFSLSDELEAMKEADNKPILLESELIANVC